MDIDENSRMQGSFKHSLNYPSRWIFLGRIWYGLRSRYRKFRISNFTTKVLGPQYRRSRSFIEIDITYLCNLHCLNCNRSSTQAPQALHISPAKIQAFVDESIANEHHWDRIRVLGGEPTLHPLFHHIIELLLQYCKWNPHCLLEVATNGYGEEVQSALALLPKDVSVENSRKSGQIQEDFGPFNLAPCDDPRYARVDYRNGCAIMEECGMGLTPMGYYPCAIAGGIDRIAGWHIGYDRIPGSNDDMLKLVEQHCALCGRFHAGHYIPKNLRPKLFETKMSKSWSNLYKEWSNNFES